MNSFDPPANVNKACGEHVDRGIDRGTRRHGLTCDDDDTAHSTVDRLRPCASTFIFSHFMFIDTFCDYF